MLAQVRNWGAQVVDAIRKYFGSEAEPDQPLVPEIEALYMVVAMAFLKEEKPESAKEAENRLQEHLPVLNPDSLPMVFLVQLPDRESFKRLDECHVELGTVDWPWPTSGDWKHIVDIKLYDVIRNNLVYRMHAESLIRGRAIAELKRLPAHGDPSRELKVTNLMWLLGSELLTGAREMNAGTTCFRTNCAGLECNPGAAIVALVRIPTERTLNGPIRVFSAHL